jgi:hypothetical protein
MADEKDESTIELAAVVQAETDGAAKRFIRGAALHGPGPALDAAMSAIEAGATPGVVLKELDAADNVLSLGAARAKREAEAREREELSELEKLTLRYKRLQHVVAALTKKTGRIRISAADLRDVGDRPRFRMRMDQGGNVLITWESE